VDPHGQRRECEQPGQVPATPVVLSTPATNNGAIVTPMLPPTAKTLPAARWWAGPRELSRSPMPTLPRRVTFEAGISSDHHQDERPINDSTSGEQGTENPLWT
jgi:hypothetical protein